MTHHRRLPPVPQLTCTGMCNVELPRIVACENVAHRKGLVIWDCNADLPAGVKFGKMKVSCEGADYSGDEVVLQGSCGLTYELIPRRAALGHGAKPYRITHEHLTKWNFFLFLVLLVLLFFAIRYMFEYSFRDDIAGLNRYTNHHRSTNVAWVIEGRPNLDEIRSRRRDVSWPQSPRYSQGQNPFDTHQCTMPPSDEYAHSTTDDIERVIERHASSDNSSGWCSSTTDDADRMEMPTWTSDDTWVKYPIRSDTRERGTATSETR